MGGIGWNEERVMSPPLSPPPREWRRATGKRLYLAHGTKVEFKLGFQLLLPVSVCACVDEAEAVVDPAVVLDAHSATSSWT